MDVLTTTLLNKRAMIDVQIFSSELMKTTAYFEKKKKKFCTIP